MNHLPREQQLEFIADVMRQIFVFLRLYWLPTTLFLGDLEAKGGDDVRDIVLEPSKDKSLEGSRNKFLEHSKMNPLEHSRTF
jgi:hypothetical protein